MAKGGGESLTVEQVGDQVEPDAAEEIASNI
jgi:hypothetical protein